MDKQTKVWPTVSRPEMEASTAVQSMFLDRVQVLAERFVEKSNERGIADAFDAVKFAYMVVKADRAMAAAFRAIERLERVIDEE